MKKVCVLAAKTTLAVSMIFCTSHARGSGIPVLDAANLNQNVMDLFEAIQQGVTQVQQYTTQLEQYKNEVMNTVAPATYVWDTANSYVNKAQQLANSVEYYANNSGGLENYLAKYQNPSSYRNSPCFSSTGCTSEEQKEFAKNKEFQADATKRALDGQMRMLNEMSRQMRSDAENLEKIQRSTESAQGRMEAAQAGNQLAANNANQLLAIRGLMAAEQEATAIRNQQIADNEASRAAADARAVSGTFKRSTGKAY